MAAAADVASGSRLNHRGRRPAVACDGVIRPREVLLRLDLVEQARRGDREVFDVLMLDAIDRMYAIARLVAQDADVAEDAVQDALVRCWRDLPSLRDVARFEPWLRKLLLNSVVEQFRGRRRFEAKITVLTVEPSTGDGSNELADRDELQRAFRSLSMEHRAIVVLHHYIGLSVAEAAVSLGIPTGTAKSRLHYALEALRAILEADARRAPAGRMQA
jgi:RNA polymerase sigma-70 factor, ECF subfamily